jgi:hypothetical protein
MQDENNVSAFQKDIDKLTLEMFMNKQTYRRFISKTDPAKHAERESYLSDLSKYGNSILELTEHLIENPDDSITTELNEIFEKYSQILIRHFKLKEVESANLYNQNEEDEDVLFGKIEENNMRVPKRSFWGKHHIIKKN